MTWTCHVCQLVSRSFAAAERHARAESHGRIEIFHRGEEAMSDTATWMRERERRLRKAAEEMSAEHFGQPDATIPDLEFSTPDCPICLQATDFDDGVFVCDVCHIGWPRSGYGRDAERYEP
jgi:hypothetical protein